MNESILESIKKLLGISPEYDHFDQDIIFHINSVFMILNQLGVGPEEGFSITGGFESWKDYIPEGSNLEIVKSYVYMKTKLMFDPPTNSSVTQAMERMISEMEFRILVAVDRPIDREEVELLK